MHLMVKVVIEGMCGFLKSFVVIDEKIAIELVPRCVICFTRFITYYCSNYLMTEGRTKESFVGTLKLSQLSVDLSYAYL